MSIAYPRPNTHSIVLGYLLWILGFTGAHRFYYGKPVTGTIWFCTFGLLGIGWLIDVFLIPGMDRRADLRYRPGPYDYSIAWLLLTFFGYLGLHRFYMGKVLTGLLYLLATAACASVFLWPISLITAPLLALGLLYDFWTINGQVSEQNALAGGI